MILVKDTIEQIKIKAEKIRWVIVDVDGVLTDGTVFMFGGIQEGKGYNVKDGLGIKLWKKAGFEFAVITSRASENVSERCRDLGIDFVFQGVANKLEVLKKLQAEKNLLADEICYIGDDLVDIPVMKNVGIAVCVADGVSEVKELATMITLTNGGKGAVRETIDWLLKQKNLWHDLINEYTGV